MRYEVVGGDMLPAIRVALTHSKRKAAAEVSRCEGESSARELLNLLGCSDASASAIIDPDTGERLHLVTMTPRSWPTRPSTSRPGTSMTSVRTSPARR